MRKLTIVLADTDEDYLMPLELKFIQGFGENADIIVITEREYLNYYFSSPRNIDILLISDELYSREFEKHNITNMFVLSERVEQTSTGDMNVGVIYKYTSVKEIFNEVYNSSTSESLKEINEKNALTKVIMVYSPIGGAGKTTIATGISAALAKSFKKVLYLSTESLQSFNVLLKNKEFVNGSFGKELAINSASLLAALQKEIRTEIFDYVLPLKEVASSLNITMKNYKYLIEKIKEIKIYDYIVVDASSEFNDDKSMLMSLCDKVIIITKQNKESCEKLERLFYNIDCSDTEKFIFICNCYRRDKTNEIINNEDINKFVINEYIKEIDIDNITLEELAENDYFQKLAYMFI